MAWREMSAPSASRAVESGPAAQRRADEREPRLVPERGEHRRGAGGGTAAAAPSQRRYDPETWRAMFCSCSVQPPSFIRKASARRASGMPVEPGLDDGEPSPVRRLRERERNHGPHPDAMSAMAVTASASPTPCARPIGPPSTIAASSTVTAGYSDVSTAAMVSSPGLYICELKAHGGDAGEQPRHGGEPAEVIARQPGSGQRDRAQYDCDHRHHLADRERRQARLLAHLAERGELRAEAKTGQETVDDVGTAGTPQPRGTIRDQPDGRDRREHAHHGKSAGPFAPEQSDEHRQPRGGDRGNTGATTAIRPAASPR